MTRVRAHNARESVANAQCPRPTNTYQLELLPWCCAAGSGVIRVAGCDVGDEEVTNGWCAPNVWSIIAAWLRLVDLCLGEIGAWAVSVASERRRSLTGTRRCLSDALLTHATAARSRLFTSAHAPVFFCSTTTRTFLEESAGATTEGKWLELSQGCRTFNSCSPQIYRQMTNHWRRLRSFAPPR